MQKDYRMTRGLRVRHDLHDRLKELSIQRGTNMSKVLDSILEWFFLEGDRSEGDLIYEKIEEQI